MRLHWWFKVGDHVVKQVVKAAREASPGAALPRLFEPFLAGIMIGCFCHGINSTGGLSWGWGIAALVFLIPGIVLRVYNLRRARRTYGGFSLVEFLILLLIIGILALVAWGALHGRSPVRRTLGWAPTPTCIPGPCFKMSPSGYSETGIRWCPGNICV